MLGIQQFICMSILLLWTLVFCRLCSLVAMIHEKPMAVSNGQKTKCDYAVPCIIIKVEDGCVAEKFFEDKCLAAFAADRRLGNPMLSLPSRTAIITSYDS